MTNIHIRQGDSTTCRLDAIVNAANNDLILGGGLAGAIARGGGPSIQEQCTRHGPIAIGQAAITVAGNLPAKYVIHQASMQLGGSTTTESLQSSTRAVLKLAEENHLRTLALPATGTGIAGFGLKECAQIMLEEVHNHRAAGTGLKDVYFILFDEAARRVFQDVHDKLTAQES
jgi:O-acetyl-ADP-ribose deacetylase (regulator of RNase III)